MSATVAWVGVFDMQVCVPTEYTDEQVVTFANLENPAGTQNGWHIIREGSKWLAGDPERVGCADRDGYVHVMLEC